MIDPLCEVRRRRRQRPSILRSKKKRRRHLGASLRDELALVIDARALRALRAGAGDRALDRAAVERGARAIELLPVDERRAARVDAALGLGRAVVDGRAGPVERRGRRGVVLAPERRRREPGDDPDFHRSHAASIAEPWCYPLRMRGCWMVLALATLGCGKLAPDASDAGDSDAAPTDAATRSTSRCSARRTSKSRSSDGGLFGVATASRKILFVQALPAMIARALVVAS